MFQACDGQVKLGPVGYTFDVLAPVIAIAVAACAIVVSDKIQTQRLTLFRLRQPDLRVQRLV